MIKADITTVTTANAIATTAIAIATRSGAISVTTSASANGGIITVSVTGHGADRSSGPEARARRCAGARGWRNPATACREAQGDLDRCHWTAARRRHRRGRLGPVSGPERQGRALRHRAGFHRRDFQGDHGQRQRQSGGQCPGRRLRLGKYPGALLRLQHAGSQRSALRQDRSQTLRNHRGQGGGGSRHPARPARQGPGRPRLCGSQAEAGADLEGAGFRHPGHRRFDAVRRRSGAGPDPVRPGPDPPE